MYGVGVWTLFCLNYEQTPVWCCQRVRGIVFKYVPTYTSLFIHYSISTQHDTENCIQTVELESFVLVYYVFIHADIYYVEWTTLLAVKFFFCEILVANNVTIYVFF